MTTLRMILVAAAAASLAGCGKTPPPPANSLPTLTLESRVDQPNQVALTFTFDHMERVNWKGRLIRAQILAMDGKPVSGGPVLKDPGRSMTFTVSVAKDPGNERAYFDATWSSENMAAEPVSLPAPGGQPNSVFLSGSADFRIRQILMTATGPGRPIPFDPDKGVDLVTVGKIAPHVYALHLWAEPPR